MFPSSNKAVLGKRIRSLVALDDENGSYTFQVTQLVCVYMWVCVHTLRFGVLFCFSGLEYVPPSPSLLLSKK